MKAPTIKGMSAGQLLSLREEIDQALAGMVQELQAQIVKIGDIKLPAAKRRATKPRSKLAGRKVPPKYRNPSNTKETWAGRGMKPKWLTDALKGGKKLDAFAVKK